VLLLFPPIHQPPITSIWPLGSAVIAKLSRTEAPVGPATVDPLVPPLTSV
jgi:hypothetical protein